ncbi:hypothetical protein ABIB83_008573 [Bradyrhizobium sp. I1.8.5]
MAKADTPEVASCFANKRTAARRQSLPGEGLLACGRQPGCACCPLGPADRRRPSQRDPGVGEAIADIITKLHRTGIHPSLEKLRKEIPAVPVSADESTCRFKPAWKRTDATSRRCRAPAMSALL